MEPTPSVSPNLFEPMTIQPEMRDYAPGPATIRIVNAKGKIIGKQQTDDDGFSYHGHF